jgi:spore maturation protein CgeB
VAPLYASVDPDAHRPSAPDDRFRGDLSYLCGCTPDRQAALDSLLYEPARRRPDLRFVVGGGQRPTGLQWTANLVYVADVPLADRPAFYCSSRLSLNVTPGPMSETGYCPPAGLFEAAACGVPVLSDDWEGLDYFFEPGLEILIARTTGHVMDALARSPEDLARIARAGRDRVLAAHTSDRRALELENLLEAALSLPVERAGQADA